MDRRSFLALAGASTLLPVPSPAQGPQERDGARLALDAAFSFGMGGGYDSKWGGSGVPEAIVHKGKRILSKATKGTYCCGYTFAVCLAALAKNRTFQALSPLEMKAFQKAWYGATEASKEKLCAYAVESFGLGKEVPLKDARAGDFVQLWRKTKKPSGHSVMLLSWVETGGKRVGIHYISSQGSTSGIGFGTEFFHGSGFPKARVDPLRTYAARI